jgi:hypothetical protein
MTSHGAKVAAFNLAEMKSKEADRREEEASVRVIHADVELSRQWTQLKAQADLVREASAAASAEALQMAIKMVQAEEELDESRRLGGETEYVNHPEAIAGIGVGWLPQISVASGGLAKTCTERIQKYGSSIQVYPTISQGVKVDLDFASVVKGTDSSVLMPLTDLDPENQQHRIYWDNILNGLGGHIPRQSKGNTKRSTTFCLYGQYVNSGIEVALGPLEYKMWDKDLGFGDDVPFQSGQILDDYVKEEMTAWIAKIRSGVSKACHSGFKNLNKNIKTHRYNTFGCGIHWSGKGAEVDRTVATAKDPTGKWWSRKAKGDGKGSKSGGKGIKR